MRAPGRRRAWVVCRAFVTASLSLGIGRCEGWWSRSAEACWRALGWWGERMRPIRA